MPITTWPKTQTILSLAAAKQALVEELIPMVEDDYLRIRNRPFDAGLLLTITGPATVDATIEVEIGSTTYEVEVLAGDDEQTVARKVWAELVDSVSPLVYQFELSLAVVRMVFVDPTASPTVTVDPALSGITATVSGVGVLYPTGAELTAIRMIQHQLAGAVGIQSESLGDHSVTYATGGSGSYPQSVTGGIKRFLSWQR